MYLLLIVAIFVRYQKKEAGSRSSWISGRTKFEASNTKPGMKLYCRNNVDQYKQLWLISNIRKILPSQSVIYVHILTVKTVIMVNSAMKSIWDRSTGCRERIY